MKIITLLIFCLGSLTISSAHAADNISNGSGWSLNYDWLNQIVNKTPVQDGLCPTLDVDVYKSGYKVALQTSFYGSVSASISKWFPKDEIWSAISVGPMVNQFGIIFADIKNQSSDLRKQFDKKLPLTAKELATWNPTDSAYWESHGGIAFYVGAGYDPVGVGAFAVATGGWANYLEKTGPNSVYVERAKKYIKSVSIGAGVGPISVGMDRAVESAKGFNYEFTLDKPANIEAFERLMAGDTTKAFELSQIEESGVKKIADTQGSKFSKAFGFSLTTPFIPLISLRASDGKDYSHEEEVSIWDEKVVKDYGFYTRQSSSRLVGLHEKQNTSFKGGLTSVESGTPEDRQTSQKFYGNFKYAYQSDYGPESKLAHYVDYAKEISGLGSEPETCVKVPSLRDALGYNQVILQMNLSDPYMREILGIATPGSKVLSQIEAMAKTFDRQARQANGCSVFNDGTQTENLVCSAPSVESTFSDIRKSVARIKATMNSDKSSFAFGMASLGKSIWSNPSVFKAFYEKGKQCGADLSFEVSGIRLSRFVKAKKFSYSDSCTLN